MDKNKRRFKRHTIEVVVLEEFNGESVGAMSLRDIADEMHSGRLVGTWDVKKSEEMSESQMADALCEAGSEPETFGIHTDDDE
jgi:hypothetical protein